MKKFLDGIISLGLAIKILPIIIFIVILLILGYYKFAVPLEKDHAELGYSSRDTKLIDQMTGEIIPKQEYYSKTYNNDELYILNKSGEKIYFKQIKELRDEIDNHTNVLGYINDSDLEKVNAMLKKLLNEYLNVTFEIRDESNEQNKSTLYIENMWVTDFSSEVDRIVQRIYVKQNN